MKIFTVSFWDEKRIFYFFLCINAVVFLYPHFYTTLDGPSHLYNARIISELLSGNKFYSEFFEMNPIPLPNWISYVLLVPLMKLFPAFLCEKILLLTYYIGLVLSFRFFVRKLNPGNISLSILIFPFVHSFVFHVGFYNFSLSFIFMFLALGWYIKMFDKRNLRSYSILALLLLVLYFSAILTLFVTCMCIAIYTLVMRIQELREFKSLLWALIRDSAGLLAAALPALLLSYNFFNKITFHGQNGGYTTTELIKGIVEFRGMLAYSSEGEAFFTRILMVILVLVFVSSFFYRKAEAGKTTSRRWVFVFPFLILFYLYFTTPNQAEAGMMSDRYCILLNFLTVMIVLSQPIAERFRYSLIVAIGVISLILSAKQYRESSYPYSKQAGRIYQTSKMLNENSAVLAIDLSDDWRQQHMSNYLTLSKPIIVLDNYEATVNWFPVKWRKDLPELLFGTHSNLEAQWWPKSELAKQQREIDYVFIWGMKAKLEEEKWAVFKETLKIHYLLVYSAEGIELYKLKS